MFLGGCEQRICFLAEMAFLTNRQTPICVRKVHNGAFLLQLSVFGKWSFFVPTSKSLNTTKIGVSAGTGEKPKWHFWFANVPFWEGASKGAFTICDT